MNRRAVLAAAVLVVFCACMADGAIRIVRTGQTYSTVQLAVNAAIDGDTIEIDSGTYLQSTAWATINKNNLTIRGVGPTRPILDANRSSLNRKAIFIITGTNTTVDFLEFTRAKCSSKNGAGIRQEGPHLTVHDCYFYDNQEGILANAVSGSNILIEYSEFNYNGAGDGQSHNMYINGVDSFTLRYSWSHRAVKGHEVKSRAKINYILYNRLTNEDGTASMEADFPNGGSTYVIGNLIHQGVNGVNGTSITYGAEGVTNPTSDLHVVNNTMVNNRSATSIAVNNYATTYAQVQNNIIQGYVTPTVGNCTLTTNWITTNAYLADPANYDYHLTLNSTGAINMGSDPGSANGFSLTPVYQYVQPCGYESRPVNGALDIGAYEY
jgi:hypothetical protein